MYTNTRNKPKKPEINTLRCGSMETWNTGSRQQKQSDDYVKSLTRQYYETSLQNYMLYMKELEKTSNPLGLGVEMPPDRSIMAKIDALPPGRPPRQERPIDKRQLLVKADMTYGDYLRQKEMAANPDGYTASSYTTGTPNQSEQYQQRGSDPRDHNRPASDGWDNEPEFSGPPAHSQRNSHASRDNGSRHQKNSFAPKDEDDGWGAPDSKAGSYQSRDSSRGNGFRGSRGGSRGGWSNRGGNFGGNSFGKRGNEVTAPSGWSDGEDDKPQKRQKMESMQDDGWDDLLPAKSKVADNRKAEDDEWDSAPVKPTKKPAASNDGDDWDSVAPAPANNDKASVAQGDDDWDSLLPAVSKKPKAPTAASTDDWDEQPSSSTQANAPKPSTAMNNDDRDDAPAAINQKLAKKKDDWSDDETPATNSYCRDSNRFRGRGSGSSHRGSCEGSYSHGSSMRGGSRSREDSNDRFRSASRASNRSDGSDGAKRPSSARQPRPGDWDCSKCKANNFSHRTDCFRCHEPKDENATSSAAASSSFQRLPRQPRPDDWNCRSCKGVNFGHRTDCFRCHEPKGENATNDAGASVSFQRLPRQPRADDWNCASCKGVNFGHRTDCFRCHEPKDENATSNSGSSSYQSRDSSRGGGYRGSRGGFRGNDSSYRGNRNYDSKPAAPSGWSDDEDDKPKTPAAVEMSGGDEWDAVKSPINAAPKIQSGGDDEWDSVSVPIKTPSLPAASKANDDDEWDSVSAPIQVQRLPTASSSKDENEWDSLAVAKTAFVVPKPKESDDDDWSDLEAPIAEPLVVESTKRKSPEEDNWAPLEEPAKKPKLSVDDESSRDADNAKGEETFDEPSSSTIDEEVVAKVSDANDDDSWGNQEKSVANDGGATDTTVNVAELFPSPDEKFNKQADAKTDDEDW